MVKDKTIIATQTMYKKDNDVDRARFGIALETVKRVRKMGIPMVIVDGGSPHRMVDELRCAGALVYNQEANTFAGSVKQAMKCAYNTQGEQIVWMEIEKFSLLPQLEKILTPLKIYDLVMARRNMKLRMKSYPKTQFHLEEFCNIYWKQLTGISLDVSFGARAMRRDSAKYFIDYNEKHGDRWECFHLPLIDMIRDRKKIADVEVDFVYPPEQKRAEEGNLQMDDKRMNQLNSVVSAWKRYLNNHNG